MGHHRKCCKGVARAHSKVKPVGSWTAVATDMTALLYVRKDKHAVPFKERHILQVCWPKPTPDDVGGSICVLVRRTQVHPTENLTNFTAIPMKHYKDDDMIERLKKDGLVVGEWVTVPDPFEEEWPFAKRHPGKYFPSEDLD